MNSEGVIKQIDSIEKQLEDGKQYSISYKDLLKCCEEEIPECFVKISQPEFRAIILKLDKCTKELERLKCHNMIMHSMIDYFIKRNGKVN